MMSAEVSTSSPSELLATGRRHLAVRDFSTAASTLASVCETLAKQYGDTADQCAEAYLWYGKALQGLSLEERGVLGEGMSGGGNADEEEVDNEADQEENGEEAQNGEAEANNEEEADEQSDEVEKGEAESTTKEEEPGSSNGAGDDKNGTTNGDADDSVANLEEDEIDNLQLAWEMLDLARTILFRRVIATNAPAARALLAEAHLALGEVALESATFDKAITDMYTCLELQVDLYPSDDRRLAETNYKIGLACTLASDFEEAILHFRNAAKILKSRITNLEKSTANEDATVQKYSSNDPLYSVESEIKELKELLPEVLEKIEDMKDYKFQTEKRVREVLCSTNGEGSQTNGSSSSANGAGPSSSSSEAKPAADISHLVRRKRKPSEDDGNSSAAKRANT